MLKSAAARLARAAIQSATLLTAGCAFLQSPPPPTKLPDRLAAFPTTGLPLDAPVTIRWDRHQIPFVEAETDADAAFALGMVHAHLRLGQLALLRQLIQGRLSESAGPLTTRYDAAIRAFDFARAADDIYAALPDDSRAWVDRFTAGINAYAAAQPNRPHEMRLLAIDWVPWTPQDSIAIGRLGGADINWFTQLALLRIADPDLRDRVFRRVVAVAQGNPPTQGPPAGDLGDLETVTQFAELTRMLGKSGSNSMVVGPQRSASGAALIANDPHLGFLIPNVWIVAGLRSPSYTIAGMMAAGTPAFGFGRNRNLAWGGTNLRARTSDLVAVGDLPADEFTNTEHDIAVRFWFDDTATTRTTEHGPVMSDLDALPDTDAAFAIRWVGHTVTDEVTALLGAMRADTFDEFRLAMETFALPSQTFLVADTAGTIGSVTASKVPARPPGAPLQLLVDPATADAHWQDFHQGADLPYATDPDAGFLASANNRPAPDGDRPFGGFFSQQERFSRITDLLAADAAVDLDELKALQLDAVSPLSLAIVDDLRPHLTRWQTDDLGQRDAVAQLLAWDGAYAAESTAALVFESFLTEFIPATYRALGRDDEYPIYQSLGLGRALLSEDMAALSEDQWETALAAALTKAGTTATAGGTWGDIHQLRVQHVLGNLPLIGRRYRIATFPVSGSRETILKTSHNLTDQTHRSTFGAQSRHVSDLADPDENYFVLLGGQDGWINSENFADQVDLWRTGDYVRVPLTPAAVATAFPHVTVLRPAR